MHKCLHRLGAHCLVIDTPELTKPKNHVAQIMETCLSRLRSHVVLKYQEVQLVDQQSFIVRGRLGWCRATPLQISLLMIGDSSIGKVNSCLFIPGLVDWATTSVASRNWLHYHYTVQPLTLQCLIVSGTLNCVWELCLKAWGMQVHDQLCWTYDGTGSRKSQRGSRTWLLKGSMGRNRTRRDCPSTPQVLCTSE